MADTLYRYVFAAMAARNEIQLYAPDEARAKQWANMAIAEVGRIEAKYSRYRDDSIVTRINGAAGGAPVEIDAETAGLLDYAATCYAQSGGRFDITSGVLRKVWNFNSGRLPEPSALRDLLTLIGWSQVERTDRTIRLPRQGMEVDFGGFGKEYAVDRAADLLYAAGCTRALVNLGGDLRVMGGTEEGDAWRVGVSHPRRPDVPLVALVMHQGALATSGDYERYFELDGRRYCHILDPRSGYPLGAWQSVSVLAPRCLIAGSISTVAMLMDLNEGTSWLSACGLRCLAIDSMGGVHEFGKSSTGS